ncbi:MAG: hypothetical protein J6A83_01365 [Clostridia bacterium]|nr:hypothetical protein [Clostridia bacterium]
MKSKILISLFVILALSLCLASCSGAEFEDETAVMKAFSETHADATVTVLDKYEISDSESYYYVRWKSPDGEENELLAIYNTHSDTTELVSLSDMSEEITASWNEVKNARPDRSFSESEIEQIMTGD